MTGPMHGSISPSGVPVDVFDQSMSQGQEIRPSHLPPEGPGASPEAGSDERQKANLLRKHVEQGLRDMAKSAQTIRDVLISARPSEGSRNRALIEDEARIAAIQAWVQGMLDPRSHIYTLGDKSSALPTTDSYPLSRDEVKQTKGEHGMGIAPERSYSDEEEEDTIPGVKIRRETGEEPKLDARPPSLAPRPNTPPAAATLPLHLIPLVSPKSSPSNRRRTSVEPSTPPNATSDATFAPQSDHWHFQTRAAAESPCISRTLAYAIGHTQVVGSSHRPISQENAGVDRKAEDGTKREGAEPETDHLSQVLVARSGSTGGDQVDVAERTRDATVQHTGVATQESHGITREKAGREEKGPRKIIPSDVEAGRIRETVGEIRTVAGSEDQDQDWLEVEQMDVHEELARGGADDPVVAPQNTQSQPEGRYNRLVKQEMEIREAKQKVEMLEEILRAREKDLCNRLEAVKQRLQVIRQRKTLIERQEDSLGRELAYARREQELEEAKLTTV